MLLASDMTSGGAPVPVEVCVGVLLLAVGLLAASNLGPAQSERLRGQLKMRTKR